jgi:flagellar basal body-associated protein FliL
MSRKIYFEHLFSNKKNCLNSIRSMINSGKKNTNKRMKIIIINIIILLVLIVIAMIVTLSIVLKLQNTINNTKTSITTGNVNSYPSMNFTYFIFYKTAENNSLLNIYFFLNDIEIHQSI